MHDDDLPHWRKRSWAEKFRNAFRGVGLGVRGQSSFFVHLFIAALVIAAGLVRKISLGDWCALALAIALVLTAEMLNSALELMAKAITHEENPHVGGALDIGSGAVLLACLGAAAVGAMVFLRALGKV